LKVFIVMVVALWFVKDSTVLGKLVFHVCLHRRRRRGPRGKNPLVACHMGLQGLPVSLLLSLSHFSYWTSLICRKKSVRFFKDFISLVSRMKKDKEDFAKINITPDSSFEVR
jgi:hypothetical protein